MAADPAPAASPPSPARWIWNASREFVNRHVCFRKCFDLRVAPETATVCVTADTRYRLYVNGRCVARGPARGFARSPAADRVAIHEFLRPGRNVIAAQVLSFGISTGQNVFRGQAGFFLDGVVACSSGATVGLHTDESWRVLEAAAYQRYAGRCGPALGWQEHYDGARPPAGELDWTGPEYDDSDWHTPRILGPAGALPWQAIEHPDIPDRAATLRAPVRVVGQWEGPDRLREATPEERADIVALAASETRTPAGQEWFERTETLLNDAPCAATLRPPPAGRCATLVVDFGETYYGHAVLQVSSAAGGEVFDLLYGEEAGAGETQADRLTCRPGGNRFESLQTRGVRHVRLVARNVRAPLTIEKLAIVEVSSPAAQRGEFDCSDARLNAIWAAGVRTLRHCLADVVMDCPTRAQADIAAARVAGLTGFYVYGDAHLQKRTLHLAAQSLRPDGVIFGVVPGEQPDSVLLDYSLHWIAALDEYYLHTGDIEILREQRAAIKSVLGFFAILCGERGLLGPAANYGTFVDCAPALDHGNLSATMNLLYLHALHHAARIGTALDDTALANHCARQASALADRIMMVFASSRRSLLVETVDLRTGTPGDLVSQHATALAVLEGVLGKRGVDRSGPVAEVLGAHVPLPGVAAEPSPVRANLFFRAFVHEALARLGLAPAALDDIRHAWGHMLDQGAPTWWEQLPLPPGAARCASWSTHPTAFLSRHVLGVTPLEPGWRRFSVRPQPSGLSHARGTVPTPGGDIEIRWETQTPGGPLRIALTVPPGNEAHVVLPGEQMPRVLAAGKHRVGQ